MGELGVSVWASPFLLDLGRIHFRPHRLTDWQVSLRARSRWFTQELLTSRFEHRIRSSTLRGVSHPAAPRPCVRGDLTITSTSIHSRLCTMTPYFDQVAIRALLQVPLVTTKDCSVLYAQQRVLSCVHGSFLQLAHTTLTIRDASITYTSRVPATECTE